MKRLLLLRHAKAVPSGQTDHDRALFPRGKLDATAVGRAIAVNGWQPEAAIVSDARRTQQTYAALGLPADTHLRLDARLYDASPDAILGVIGETGDDAATLLVVGHNPGIALLARRLAGHGDDGELARLRGSFPTACLAVLTFAAATWPAIADGEGTLAALLWADPAGS